MSLEVCYYCLTQAELDALLMRVREEDDALWKWLYPETPSFAPPAPTLCIERVWVGLHSLLTFGVWEQQPLLGRAILGGREVGFPFVYTDINYLTAEEARQIAAALETVSESALAASFDADAMNAAGLPPESCWQPTDFPYLWQAFVQIRDFFSEAAHFRDAILLIVS